MNTVSRTCLLQGKLTAILLGRRVEREKGRVRMEVEREEGRVGMEVEREEGRVVGKKEVFLQFISHIPDKKPKFQGSRNACMEILQYLPPLTCSTMQTLSLPLRTT